MPERVRPDQVYGPPSTAWYCSALIGMVAHLFDEMHELEQSFILNELEQTALALRSRM